MQYCSLFYVHGMLGPRLVNRILLLIVNCILVVSFSGQSLKALKDEISDLKTKR